MEGKLVIISAPSGAGKTTIVKHLLNSGLNLAFSVSATTRELRSNEIDGKDYYFISVPEFKKRIENDEFVEWEEVYKDLIYGTLKSELERIWENGCHVIFDVDVRGGINLKKIFGARSISIFIMPPSVEELELANQFDTVIINHHLDKAKEEVHNTVSSFLEDKSVYFHG
jgi:guanylate kinase